MSFLGDLFKGAAGAGLGFLTGGPVGALAGGLGGLAVGGAQSADDASRQAALDLAKQQRAENQKFIQEQVAKTQGQLFTLFPQIQQGQQAGLNASVNALKQGMGAQLNAFNGGNMNAQQTLLAGIPQANLALMGGPIDYSQFQARQVTPPAAALSGNYAPPPQFAPFDIAALGGGQPVQAPQIDYNALAAALRGQNG